METWLTFIKQQSEQTVLESPDVLAKLFTLDLGNPQVASIQSSTAQLSEQNISDAVESAGILNDEWPGLVSLAKSYLVWCAFIDPSAPQSCFTYYANVFLSAQQAYANFRGSCLNLVVRDVATQILRLFGSSGDHLYLEWIASGLLKLFNAVRSEREPPSKHAPSKKDNALFYANMISRAYFRCGQFVSAGNVFNNMHSLTIAASSFPRAEQVEYRYWLGRYLLYCNEPETAFMHLNWAYENTPGNLPQSRMLLEWLVVPSILVGRIPRISIIKYLVGADALRAVEALIMALRTGVLPANYESAVSANPWVTAKHLRPVIDTHLPLLLERTRLKRLIRLSGADKIPLTWVRTAFQMTPQSDPELLITESTCETLIHSGLLKVRVLPASQMLILKAHGSVPPLLEVNQVLVRNLPDRDQWLQR